MLVRLTSRTRAAAGECSCQDWELPRLSFLDAARSIHERQSAPPQRLGDPTHALRSCAAPRRRTSVRDKLHGWRREQVHQVDVLRGRRLVRLGGLGRQCVRLEPVATPLGCLHDDGHARRGGRASTTQGHLPRARRAPARAGVGMLAASCSAGAAASSSRHVPASPLRASHRACACVTHRLKRCSFVAARKRRDVPRAPVAVARRGGGWRRGGPWRGGWRCATWPWSHHVRHHLPLRWTT